MYRYKYNNYILNTFLFVISKFHRRFHILHCGFLFNDEDFSIGKMHSIYGEIENILYLFSESKYYIDMTHKEVAMAIIGFVREMLGLISFSKNIQNVFMHEYVDIHNYVNCLNKLRKCFMAFLVMNIIIQGIDKIENCIQYAEMGEEEPNNNISFA